MRLLSHTHLVQPLLQDAFGATPRTAQGIEDRIGGAGGMVDLWVLAPARRLGHLLLGALQGDRDEAPPEVEVRVLATLEVHHSDGLEVFLWQVLHHVILGLLWCATTVEPAGSLHLLRIHAQGAPAFLFLQDFELLLCRQKRSNWTNELLILVRLGHILLHDAEATGLGLFQWSILTLFSEQEVFVACPLCIGNLRIVASEIIFSSQCHVQLLNLFRRGDIFQGTNRPLHHSAA
mmetsp:Transcript_15613/g.26550  ORF Transcript_15613/g.26550 Transcript_15613/m.26550 type:complete len:234 (-) Transcript_15613:1514-2215(-)